MATNILKSINQSDVPTDFNSVSNSAKIQMINLSDEDMILILKSRTSEMRFHAF
jgi:hypothetical protein